MKEYVYILFVFSGMLKTLIDIPIDLTVLLFVISVLLGLITLVRRRMSVNIPVNLMNILRITFVFASITLISISYSPSNFFYLNKLLGFTLLIYTFLYPIIFFRNADRHKLTNLILYFSIAWSLFLCYVFVRDGNLGIINSSNSDNMPDYLVLGLLLSIGSIASLKSPIILTMIVVGMNTLLLVFLGGRGPLLWLYLTLAFVFLFKTSFKKKMRYGLSIVVIASLILRKVTFRDLPVFSRFDALISGSEPLRRLEHIDNVKSVVAKFPLTGVGFGGYGEYFYSLDERLYPHNLFLETLAESGLLACTILLILFCIVFFKAVAIILEKKNKIIDIIPELMFLVVFIEALKSSSIVDLRLLFALGSIVLINNKTYLKKSVNKISVDLKI